MLSTTEIVVVVLSGFCGAILVLLTTFFAAKYGSISGIITTIPTNTLVSLLGIAINTDNYTKLQRGIYGTLVLSFCAFIYLMLFWIYLPGYIEKYKYPITVTTVSGIGFYTIITSISYKYLILESSSGLSTQELLSLSLFSIFKYYYFTSIHKYIYKFKNEDFDKNKKASQNELIWRFVVTFALISFIVFIGKLNEDIGIIISCFPLLSLINSVILWKQTRNSVLVSQLNSNILIGGTTIYMYVICFAFFLKKLNLWLDVFVSLLFSLAVYNLPIYISLLKMNKFDKSVSEQVSITEV